MEAKLPPKLETTIHCPLSEMQTFWYRRLLMRDSSLVSSLEADAAGKGLRVDGQLWRRARQLLMQLRKVCNHPYLFPDAEPVEPTDGGDYSTGEDVVEASGKVAVLDRLLARLKAAGHRVVIFSQFTTMLDVLQVRPPCLALLVVV